MHNTGWPFHKRARFARLWIPMPAHNPCLRKVRSTFPRMTTGTMSGILDLDQINISPGWIGKGNNHESTFLHSAKRGSRTWKLLRLLWRTSSVYAQLEASVVVGVFVASRHEHRIESVSGLPPAPPGPSYRIHCQRPHVTVRQTRKLPHGLASTLNAKDDREGQRQAPRLTYPSRQAWAHGR